MLCDKKHSHVQWRDFKMNVLVCDDDQQIVDSIIEELKKKSEETHASIEFSVIALNRNQIVKIFLILLSCFIVARTLYENISGRFLLFLIVVEYLLTYSLSFAVGMLATSVCGMDAQTFQADKALSLIYGISYYSAELFIIALFRKMMLQRIPSFGFFLASFLAAPKSTQASSPFGLDFLSLTRSCVCCILMLLSLNSTCGLPSTAYFFTVSQVLRHYFH